MQASQKQGNRDGYHGPYYQPKQELESYAWPPSHNLDHSLFSDDGSQSTAPFGYPFHNSPSTGSSVSQPDYQSNASDPNHSPDHPISSAVSGICSTDDFNDLRHKLRELETAMLGPDSDILEACNNMSVLGEPNQISLETDKWEQVMETINRRDLKEMLIECARAVEENDPLTTEWLMSELRQMVSVSGDPIQRLGAYMLEGLVARLASSGSTIYKALKCKEPAGSELLSYMHLLYEVCPIFKFGYMSANGAIAEAMKDENVIHIIDFQIAQGSQWVTLIQALASRPGGPPRIHITGIDDSTSAYARGGGLDIVGQRLSRFAESCKVPFEFHALPVSGSKVELQDLRVQPGEPLAVNFAFMLHHMPDESVGPQNHRDRLLRLVKSLCPKIVTLVEQESNTNTTPFFLRFVHTLNYFAAVFESIDVTLPRESKERVNVEQHCLAREIVNVIACEGAERVERHELLGKWRSRFTMAGFVPYPLNSMVNATIGTLLESYSGKYRLEERDGALYLGWMNQDLVASCAWK